MSGIDGVRIRGDGVAAGCCARLLEGRGLPVILEPGGRSRVPAVMLGEATQKLLADVFERSDLFDGLPRIHRRVVKWGTAKTIAVPHSAVLAPEQTLLERIGQPRPPGGSADWTILAAPPLPAAATEHHFGTRVAAASRATLKPGADPHSCWVESLERGWLFLLPAGRGEAWLVSVGAALAESCLVTEQIAATGEPLGSFPCHPRIADPLCGPGWLACGSAALGFDPLCGDGVGYATREAILASAVVRAVAAGTDTCALLDHYQARLTAAFHRHLEICQEFYRTGGDGPWWNQERDALERGLVWCRQRLQAVSPFRFRLHGFDLESVT